MQDLIAIFPLEELDDHGFRENTNLFQLTQIAHVVAKIGQQFFSNGLQPELRTFIQIFQAIWIDELSVLDLVHSETLYLLELLWELHQVEKLHEIQQLPQREVSNVQQLTIPDLV